MRPSKRIPSNQEQAFDTNHGTVAHNSTLPPSLDVPVVKSLEESPVILRLELSGLVAFVGADGSHPFFGQRRIASDWR